MRCESETDRARTGFQLAAQFVAGSFLLSGDTGGDHVRLPRQRADQRGAFRIPVCLFECCQAAHVIPGCWPLVGGNVYLGAGIGISACVHRDRGGSAAAADSGLRLFPRLCGQLYGGVVRQAGRFDGRRFFRTAVSDYVSVFFPAGCSILGSGRCALSSILWERIPGAGGQPQMLAAAYRCVFDPVFGDLAGSSAVAGSSAGAAGTDILGYFRRWRL